MLDAQKIFIEKVSALAVVDYKSSKIFPSITIAQAILESNWGRSKLATEANNLFGMKCYLSGNTWESCWDGVSSYNKETKEEYSKGNITTIKANFRKYPSISDSIKDHSLYLVGARNGSSLRYKGLSEASDYQKQIQIIKEGGYATDSQYVSKICNIIETYSLDKYDSVIKGVTSMNIKQSILTKNPCYTAGRKITVKGLMLHSVGCPQPSAQVFINNWNRTSFGSACVHGFIDANTGTIYQTLPWNHRGWHCGSGSKGSGNNTHIGIEMCEPALIKYTGGSSFTCSDLASARAAAKRTYNSAVELFAYLCKQYGLNPLGDGVIVSHKEGHTRGIASNHGDPEHLWRGLGLSYTMNGFRNDVKAKMNGSVSSVSAPASSSNQKTELYRVRKSWNDAKSQIGAFSNLTNAKNACKSGYKVFDSKGNQVYPVAATFYKVRVTTDALNIRKGAGTNYGIAGCIKDKGIYTIVKTSGNWGKLKSGAGWICLDYTQKI